MEQQHNNSEQMNNSGSGEAERYVAGSRGRGRGMVPAGSHEPHRQTHHQSPSGNISDIVKNSVLSAEAAEFVPKSYSGPSQGVSRGSVQDRLQLARQNQNVQQVMLQRHVPWQQSGCSRHYHQQHFSDGAYHGGYRQPYNQYSNVQNYSHYDGGSGDYADKHLEAGPFDISGCLIHLENAIRTLTMNPGRFDSLLGSLIDNISPFLDQPNHCETIFNVIIQQSIHEGNFRYSGARLCTHIDTIALTGDKTTSIFRETLLNQCKQKTDEQAETWQQITIHTDDVEKKCHGLIFFLAELVTQMEPTPASELGKLLIKLINTVLKNPAPNSAKNICQALKLAGQTLERDNSGNRSGMEQVMRMLSDLVIQNRVDSSVGRMVTSVSELRSGNWGVNSTHNFNVETRQPSSSQVTDEPVFYGPDGEELTEEESRFLEQRDLEDEISAHDLENDEFSDEMADAYEEFLEYSRNNNKENQKNVQANK